MKNMFRSLEVAENHFAGLPNVIGMGIGYKKRGRQYTDEPAVIFFVDKKVPVEALGIDDIIPRRIAGKPTDVIEVGEIRLLGRTEKRRPAVPGVSIAHYKVTAGTFGAVVKDRKTDELLILSNNHVLANATDGHDGKSRIGDPVYQPGSYDGGTGDDMIGNLVRFVPFSRYNRDVDCKLASMGIRAANAMIKTVRPHYNLRLESLGSTNLVDCALARPVKPELIGTEILEIGRVNGIGEIAPGAQVKKSGRTSGITTGTVKAVKVSLNVNMGHGNDVVRFNDQVMAELKSLPGDSGALILDKSNRAVGLLFAGSNEYTVFNPIQTVCDHLGVDIV
ncbi:MAG: hypothetical protein ABSA82_02740 [Thermacetogeniaceae bacterium]|jgi:hypothetical protein